MLHVTPFLTVDFLLFASILQGLDVIRLLLHYSPTGIQQYENLFIKHIIECNLDNLL